MTHQRLPLISIDTDSELIDLIVIEFDRRNDAEWIANKRSKIARAKKREDNLSRRRWKRSLRDKRRNKEVANA